MDSTPTSFFDKQPIFILDHESHDILDINDAAVELYGYTREEFLSLNVNDLGEKTKRIDLIKGAECDDGSVDKIWIQETKEGKKLFTQFTYHTFYHEGRPAKIAIAHDVSQQVREQEKRRVKFPKFVTHETNFPLAEIEWNANLKVSNWSEKAQELFGWREEEVVGEPDFFKKLIAEDELEQAQENLQHAVKNHDTNYSVEGTVNTKNGDSLICEWHNSLIYDANGNLHSMYSLVTDISQRKESQKLFRTLSEKSLVGVFLIQDGRFKYVNPRLAEIFGYEQQEIIDGFLPHDLVHPTDRAFIKENMRKRLNGIRQAEEYEAKGVTKQKRIIDLSIHGTKTTYRGKPAIVGTVLDITRDKEIVHKYQASVETFQELFNSINDAIYIQDDQGVFLEVNQGTVDMFGYEKEYLIGQSPELLSATAKVNMPAMQKRIKKVLEGEDQNFEWWGKRKNGEVFPEDISITKGTYFGQDVVITIARDVSERYEAEEELRKNEELFRQLFQNAPIPISLMDKRQEIRQINDAFTETFGYETPEVQGIDIDKLIVPEEEKETALGISNTIFEGKTAHHSGKRLAKDGNLVDVLIYGVPVIVNGKTVAIFGIYVDITDRKQAEEKVKKSLKEKEVLLAEIHHRVKNNLAVITGLLELQAYNTNSEEAKDVLEESQMRVNSIALIHEKLYQNKNLSEISFDVYLEQLTDVIISSLHTTQTEVKINIDADPVKLTVNQAIPCGLILNEIVTNAHKHAFDGREHGKIDISLKQDGDDITLKIKDDGAGLPADIEVNNPNSLGLKLIDTLSTQLSGTAEFRNADPGTEFILQFEFEE